MDRGDLRKVRYIVQAVFVAITIWIGVDFYRFVRHFESSGFPPVDRPSGVDAFLPIGGLMAFKYYVFTGIVDPVHPAGLVIFVSVLAVSLLFKKGFCGWICPIGTASQYLWMAGEKVFARNARIPEYGDIALRSLKYMLLALFLLLIGVAMTPNMMVLFFITDYYKTADVRTMKFFTEMSGATALSLVALAGLSAAYKNFWCRYLCPYGALLGLLSRLSPLKIRRNEAQCTHCGACSRNCPSMLDVEKSSAVKSEECFACLTCLSHCPSKGALDVASKKRSLNPYLYPVLLVTLFYLIIGLGAISGNWRSQVPYEEYKRILSVQAEK